jgi:hypothetical protein
MKQIKWIFILFALFATASMMGIGIAIAERSIVGILFSVISLLIVMGTGFSLKKKFL